MFGSGGQGFWSPTHNRAAQLAFVDHIRRRGRRSARRRARSPLPGRWVLGALALLGLLALLARLL